MILEINARLQEQIASMMAGAGLIWAAKAWTASRSGINALVNTPGVVELLCVSILIWLIAKWRGVSQRSLARAEIRESMVEERRMVVHQ